MRKLSIIAAGCILGTLAIIPNGLASTLTITNNTDQKIDVWIGVGTCTIIRDVSIGESTHKLGAQCRNEVVDVVKSGGSIAKDTMCHEGSVNFAKDRTLNVTGSSGHYNCY